MKKGQFLLFLLLLLMFSNWAMAASKADLQQAILASISQTSVRPFNGHILICQGKKVLFQKVQGYQDFNAKLKLAKHQQFILGSVGKQITSVLVLQAIEKGLLRLDQSIREFFPNAECPELAEVQIHHLLNHTSGIDQLSKPLKFKPGSQFAYSNYGYNLLGSMLEIVHKKSFILLARDLFVQNKLQGMTDVFDGKNERFAKGWVRDSSGQILPLEEIEYPMSSLASALFVSDARSLAKWNQLLHHGKILEDSSYRKLIRPSSTRNHPIFGNVDYGYGLQMTAIDDLKEISHGGYVEGFATVNFYYPEKDISLIVMENLDWMDPTFKETFWHPMRARDALRKWILAN